jgi:hypothetical protein
MLRITLSSVDAEASLLFYINRALWSLIRDHLSPAFIYRPQGAVRRAARWPPSGPPGEPKANGQ